jgi:hypothetical protein
MLVYNKYFLGKEVMEYKNLCFGFLCTFCLNFLILRRTERGMIINTYRPLYEITFVLLRF